MFYNQNMMKTKTDNIIVKIISSTEDFEQLQQAWDKLHVEIEGTIFQTFIWNFSWWNIYKQGNFRLCILTVWVDSHLAAIFPFFGEYISFLVLKYSRLRFLGTADTYGEYQPLVNLKFQKEVAGSALEFCKKILSNGEFDNILLFRFPPESAFMKFFLDELRESDLNVKFIPYCIPRIMMDLPDKWEKYLSQLSSNERDLLKRRHKSLLKYGVKLEISQDSQLTDKDVDDFVRLHRASWSVRGVSDYYSSKYFEKFHRKMILDFKNANVSKIFYFTKDGERFAAVQIFSINGVCCFYLSGLNRLHSLVQYSPGKVLLSLVIKHAIETGQKVFDFQGGYEEYKYRLGGKKTSFAKAILCKQGIKTYKVNLIQFVISIKQKINDELMAQTIKPFFKKITNNIFK
jgi:hypothetical protein